MFTHDEFVPRERLPFTFFNDDGELMGFDIELFNMLAQEMGLALEFIPVTWDTLQEQLNSGEVDVFGSLPLSTYMLASLDLSEPYTDGLLSLVVRDHRRGEFMTARDIAEQDELVVAYPGPVRYIEHAVRYWLPGNHIRWHHVDTFHEFFEQQDNRFDALLVEAEIGTAWTLLHPEYDVVVPEHWTLRMPAGFAVARGEPDLAAFLNRWLEAKHSTGELDRAYDYWVLGQGAETHEPRWSIARNVLGWIE